MWRNMIGEAMWSVYDDAKNRDMRRGLEIGLATRAQHILKYTKA